MVAELFFISIYYPKRTISMGQRLLKKLIVTYPYFFMTHFNIFYVFMPTSPKLSTLFRFPDQYTAYISHFLMHAKCPAKLIFLNVISLIVTEGEHVQSYSLCSPLPPVLLLLPLVSVQIFSSVFSPTYSTFIVS